MGIAKVALGVSLISPLACTQLCAKQLEMWTVCTIIGIAFGGPIATQCLEHFPDTRELSFTKVVYQSFDRTSYDIIILYIYIYNYIYMIRYYILYMILYIKYDISYIYIYVIHII